MLTSWRLRAATSRPVGSPPSPRSQPVTAPTAFSFSDGIQTRLNAGLPPGVEPFFDLEECDSGSGFDDPLGGDSAEPEPRISPDASESPQWPIDTYVVKDIAYRTSVGELREVLVSLTDEI